MLGLILLSCFCVGLMDWNRLDLVFMFVELWMFGGWNIHSYSFCVFCTHFIRNGLQKPTAPSAAKRGTAELMMSLWPTLSLLLMKRIRLRKIPSGNTRTPTRNFYFVCLDTTLFLEDHLRRFYYVFGNRNACSESSGITDRKKIWLVIWAACSHGKIDACIKCSSFSSINLLQVLRDTKSTCCTHESFFHVLELFTMN